VRKNTIVWLIRSYLPRSWGTVGWGTALQVARLRVRFPMVSLEFFIDITFQAALWSLTKMSTKYIFWGVRRPVPRADNLTTFMSRLSWNFFSSSVGWTDAICHQSHRYTPSLHRVDTKLTLEWGFHLLYNTLINYSPEHFRHLYYSPAAQNPMSNILTVLMAQTANVSFLFKV